MNIIFYKTNDVFVAEERLQEYGITTQIVPTPVQDKAYCGVCVKVSEIEVATIDSVLEGLEYQIF